MTAAVGDGDDSFGDSVHPTKLGGHFSGHSTAIPATCDVGDEFLLPGSKPKPIGYTVVDGRPTLRLRFEEASPEPSQSLPLSLRGFKRPIDLTDRSFAMTRRKFSRRWFLKASVALAATAPLIAGLHRAQAGEAGGPLVAYVGTFSSPLRDTLPTQVDLPPGNGRGIHLFRVDRATGAMTPAGVCEMGTSPGCLALNAAGTRLYSANETDRVGKDKEGTVERVLRSIAPTAT